MIHGIQNWDSTKISDLNVLQFYQWIGFHFLTNAPYYVDNRTIHYDINILALYIITSIHYKKYYTT